MTEWYEKFVDLLNNRDENIDRLALEVDVAKAKDEGIIHPSSGAGLLFSEDGDVHLSSDKMLGITMDKEKEAMIIVAPNLHIFSNNIRTHEIIGRDNELPKALKDITKKIEDGES